MKYLLLIVTLPLISLNHQTNCEKLQNGTYLVTHTSYNGAIDYQLKITDNNYVITVNDTMSITGNISKIGDCLFKLSNTKDTNQDTSAIARAIHNSFGEPCFEIKSVSGDTTYFRTTYSANLHISLNEGYLLKIK